LSADLAGFTLIGWELIKQPSDRLFLHGQGPRTRQPDFWDFLLVLLGFVLQLCAQVVTLTKT
jgi:hypothetical protein